MSVTIKEVKTGKEFKTFVQFANRLYEGCPYYIPTLDFDEKNTFDPKKNPALAFSEYILYLAYKDDKVVGRVAALINHRANERWNYHNCRFGWFDFIDDMEVSRALLDAVTIWGRSKGMTKINGPVGFTDFDKEGVVISGFEHLGAMTQVYNFPYYQAHYETYGLEKEADWFEYLVFPPKEVPERWARLSEIVAKRSKLHMANVRSVAELKKRYPNLEYFNVLDAAYQNLYNYTPMTEEQKRYYADMYFSLLNFDFVEIVENEKNEIVAVGLGMPNVSEEMRRANGSLFPFAWFHLLKKLHSKHLEKLDFLLIGVRPDYQDTGALTMIFNAMIPTINRYGIKALETTGILETNHKNRANFEMFDHDQYRVRRAFAKAI